MTTTWIAEQRAREDLRTDAIWYETNPLEDENAKPYRDAPTIPHVWVMYLDNPQGNPWLKIPETPMGEPGAALGKLIGQFDHLLI